MDSRLVVARVLPCGRTARVFPFHISMEGLESELICRDGEDYDRMVKYIALCAWCNNVIVIIYAVVSNHAHMAVLCENKAIAEKYISDVKKRHSMWLNHKYECSKVLKRTNAQVYAIDTVSYARNVLAYIPRNAIDNCAANVVEYKWSGFRGMFSHGKTPAGSTRVRDMNKRAFWDLFHTNACQKEVPWMVNENGELEPSSFCDSGYLEMIYNHDQSFFLKMVGGVNVEDVEFRRLLAVSVRMSDSEFLKTVDDYARKWYQMSVSQMSMANKMRMLGYLKRILRLSVPQVSRCFGIDRKVVHDVLKNDSLV